MENELCVKEEMLFRETEPMFTEREEIKAIIDGKKSKQRLIEEYIKVYKWMYNIHLKTNFLEER